MASAPHARTTVIVEGDSELNFDDGNTIESNRQPPEPLSHWRLLIHFIVGTFVFVVVALLTVCLSLGIDYLAKTGVNSVIIWGLRIAEYLLLVVDLLLFIVFVLRTAWRTLRKL